MEPQMLHFLKRSHPIPGRLLETAWAQLRLWSSCVFNNRGLTSGQYTEARLTVSL